MVAPIDDLRGFLDAAAYREAHPRAPGKAGDHPFVTISRQAGAGGHALARILLNEMNQADEPLFQGWRVFDRELCERLMEDPALHRSMRSLLTEEYRSAIEDAIFSILGGETPQYAVAKKLFETIRMLATLGRVIIVGRAGMCVTRGLPAGVHLRLVASEATRIKRMTNLLQVSEPEARRIVYKQDHDRARLVRDYFFRDIHDPLLYDVIWNTDAVRFKAIAASVLGLITQRAQAGREAGLEPAQRASEPVARWSAEAGPAAGGLRPEGVARPLAGKPGFEASQRALPEEPMARRRDGAAGASAPDNPRPRGVTAADSRG